MIKMILLTIYVCGIILVPLELFSKTAKVLQELKDDGIIIDKSKKKTPIVTKIADCLKLMLLSFIPIVNLVCVIVFNTEEFYDSLYSTIYNTYVE